MEKFTIANGVAFRYLDTGVGEQTILFIHGYLESIEVWESLVSKMGKKFRIVALDLPGHGISEVKGEVHTMEFLADTIDALLEKIGVKRCVVVGHSMGGYVALAFADKYKDKCAGLVLLHSTPNGDTPEKADNRRREIEIIKANKKELLATTNPGKGFAKDNKAKFADFIDSLEQQAMLTEDEGIIAMLNGMMERKDMNDMLDKFNIPTLFVFGEKDEYIPVEYAQSIVSRHPKTQVLWLKESGHMGYVEQESLFIEALDKFTTEAY